MNLVSVAVFSLVAVLAADAKAINVYSRQDGYNLAYFLIMAEDFRTIESVLKSFPLDDVRNYLATAAKDLKAVENLTRKLLMHDYTTPLELSDDEHMLMYLLMALDNSLPHSAQDERPLFLGECKQEYDATDFSSFDDFQSAKSNALTQIAQCMDSGWRTTDAILDIENVSDETLLNVECLSGKLLKLRKAVREMFNLARLYQIVAAIDDTPYPNKDSYNDAFKKDVYETLEREETEKHAQMGYKRREDKENDQTNQKKSSLLMPQVSKAANNVYDEKRSMLVGNILKALGKTKK